MQCKAMDASRQEDGAGKEEGDVAMDQSGDAAPKKTESKNLDLAFAMDCTGSMGSYIHQAQKVCLRSISDSQPIYQYLLLLLFNCLLSYLHGFIFFY